MTAQLARVIEYIDYMSAMWLDPFGECPDMTLNLELWGMWSSSSLPLFPGLLWPGVGPLWSGVVTPGRVLSMGQIELNYILMLNWIVWNRIVFTFNCINS